MTNGNSNALSELRAITAEALAALDTGHRISPFSARLSAFDLDDAYRVAAAIRQMREAANLYVFGLALALHQSLATQIVSSCKM
jgi:2-keto-4-pentenoate hydratase